MTNARTRGAHDRAKIPVMKLHSTQTLQYQTVTGYEDDWIEINAKRYGYSLVVLPEVSPWAWPVAAFESLKAADFDALAATEPDLVILGTGKRQHFVAPRVVSALISRHIGVECMDNQAACRTYNILMAEGRKVALALILPGHSQF